MISSLYTQKRIWILLVAAAGLAVPTSMAQFYQYPSAPVQFTGQPKNLLFVAIGGWKSCGESVKTPSTQFIANQTIHAAKHLQRSMPSTKISTLLFCSPYRYRTATSQRHMIYEHINANDRNLLSKGRVRVTGIPALVDRTANMTSNTHTILMGHSHGGDIAIRVGMQAKATIKALYSIEPVDGDKCDSIEFLKGSKTEGPHPCRRAPHYNHAQLLSLHSRLQGNWINVLFDADSVRDGRKSIHGKKQDYFGTLYSSELGSFSSADRHGNLRHINFAQEEKIRLLYAENTHHMAGAHPATWRKIMGNLSGLYGFSTAAYHPFEVDVHGTVTEGPTTRESTTGFLERRRENRKQSARPNRGRRPIFPNLRQK
jgi:hypothetical protein